ncbi:Endolytic peptidoglycan transglycosylase RlpA [Dyadobacter sp. CECT 9623]|jgi:rare lipoprotein A|uniref:Probable endolytic peptidoglycan transglycosylase RlpA n=1 Tax=Dyadobacter linearis TaxID=2823330 RepID=A0ABN7R957_9BACT|nr:septal ring lytic transglycosylase RlpA family protein [Dyadobacter sp. CECT 9623]CAG5070831.1 Endolytic peptidoglycan transglycosylase RlpA [Dyadobacter sp. CECT 9623]
MTYRRTLILILLAFAAAAPETIAQVKLGKTETGNASYYASRFNGKKTSFGEVHKSSQLLAAHRSYPLNTMLEVTNLNNDEKVIVRVNDRGPFAKNRIVDLSKEAARLLGIVTQGVANVSVRVVGMEGMVLLESYEHIDPKSGKVIAMRGKQ